MFLLISDLEQEEKDLFLEESNNQHMSLEIINANELEYDSNFGITVNGTILSIEYQALIVMSNEKIALLIELAKEFMLQKKKVIGIDINSLHNVHDNLHALIELQQKKLPVPYINVKPCMTENSQPEKLIDILNSLHINIPQYNIDLHSCITLKNIIVASFHHNETLPWFLNVNLKEIELTKEQLNAKFNIEHIYECEMLKKSKHIDAHQIEYLMKKISIYLKQPNYSVIFGKIQDKLSILSVYNKNICKYTDEEIIHWYITKWKKLLM